MSAILSFYLVVAAGSYYSKLSQYKQRVREHGKMHILLPIPLDWIYVWLKISFSYQKIYEDNTKS